MATGTGYVNGGDLIICVATKPTGSSTATYKAIGHCTQHTTTFSSETKDRAVKAPVRTTTLGAGLFKDKTVTGLSAQIKADGLRYYGESEEGIGDLLTKWKAGEAILVKAFVRSNDSAPYLSGEFVITSLEESATANEDATYNVTLDNSGEVTIDAAKVNGVTTGGL